jgi:hypothetical protein
LLQLVVKSGFEAIWKLIPPGVPDAAQRTAIATAVNAADAISSQRPTPAASDVVTRIQTMLLQLNNSLGGGGAAANLVADSFKPRTAEQILTEIRTFSRLAWFVFALFTTALGTYVLILSNLGFGTCLDFFICLFWGFGLPAGGTQLAQATTSSASTALGFSISKSS